MPPDPKEGPPMNKHIRRTIVPLFLLALLALASAGCNTTHGFGKDVQETGEGIQKMSK